MKKRKTPILLFSMLLVLVGGFVVFQLSQGNSSKQAAPVSDQITKEHDTLTPDEVAASAKSNTSVSGMKHGGLPPSAPNTRPTIEVPPNAGHYSKPKIDPNN